MLKNEYCLKYLKVFFECIKSFCGLVNVVLLLITVQGTELQVPSGYFSFLIPFQVFSRSLILVWIQFIKYDSLLIFIKIIMGN